MNYITTMVHQGFNVMLRAQSHHGYNNMLYGPPVDTEKRALRSYDTYFVRKTNIK